MIKGGWAGSATSEISSSSKEKSARRNWTTANPKAQVGEVSAYRCISCSPCAVENGKHAPTRPHFRFEMAVGCEG